MRKLILSMHITLDGFVAGPNGEMDWIRFDEELFDLVGKVADEADTALYGRVTYQMMDNYWPTAADQPNATRHDIHHSNWYNNAHKVVLSRTMKGTVKHKTKFIGDNVVAEVQQLKNQPGKHIMIFGSPTAAHTLMAHNLIDEYWLLINPVLLGQGIPLFADISGKTELKLETTKVFNCGVTLLYYTVLR